MLPNYQLIHAIKSGCTADFNDAVERGATVESRDIDGRSVLEVAMRRGRVDLARRLIRDGADPNGAIGKRGDRLMHIAARTGNIGFLTVLLDEGVDPDSTGNRDRTALHHVSIDGYEFMARMLLKRGANPNATDSRGNTPLHFAAIKGNLVMIKLLLNNSANAGLTNNQLYTPIHNAAANGHTDAVKQLIEHVRASNPRFKSLDLTDRIRRVAERHDQHETANAIATSHCRPEFNA